VAVGEVEGIGQEVGEERGFDYFVSKRWPGESGKEWSGSGGRKKSSGI
jgi:hypothetical protein